MQSDERFPMNHVRVLFLDDDSRVLRTIERLLRRDLDIELASTPLEAMTKLAAQPFDVIVSDFCMPEFDVDGLTFLQTVRETWPNIRRVLHSGSMPNDIHRHLASGAIHSILHKPALREQIFAALGIELRPATSPPEIAGAGALDSLLG